jgi:methionyl-tRNA formyltransferase
LRRLGFAGTPEFAVAALRRLNREFGVSAVFTQPDRPAGRGQSLQFGPVKKLALELGIPLHQPDSFKTTATLDLLRSLQLDALVVVAYGQILPQAALDAPRLGCVNIHASLLPRWRGAAPIQRAILAGDGVTGVTIMRMEAGLDTGPMLSARSIPIGAHDTAASLHDRLSLLGADLVSETLPLLAAGELPGAAQPAAGVTYAAKLAKHEARIDWQGAAPDIDRQVRGLNPWPIAQTLLKGEQLRIWEAQVEAADAAGGAPADAPVPGTVLQAGHDGIRVQCGAGTLRVTRLQLAGRKTLAAREFLQGWQHGVGVQGLRLGTP